MSMGILNVSAIFSMLADVFKQETENKALNIKKWKHDIVKRCNITA